MSVYAVSDLHGQFNTFIEGLKKIDFKDDDRLYFIGDAIDRGPDGIKILKYIKKHENMDLIIGNHEFMMLNSVDLEGKNKCNGMDSNLWLYANGGRITFEKYIKLKKSERLELLEWLKERYVIKVIAVGERLFCLTHSYFKKGLENKKYSELKYHEVDNIVWTSFYRSESLTHGIDLYGNFEEYTFITGHVPVIGIMRNYYGQYNFNRLEIYQKGNFIDIDGACAAGYQEELNNGALFLRLDDMEVFTVPLKGSKDQ